MTWFARTFDAGAGHLDGFTTEELGRIIGDRLPVDLQPVLVELVRRLVEDAVRAVLLESK